MAFDSARPVAPQKELLWVAKFTEYSVLSLVSLFAAFRFALADKQMSAAITCMHDDLGHPWTLQKLAKRVGMSRKILL